MKTNQLKRSLVAVMATVLFSMAFSSCTTNDPIKNLATKPEALAAYDNSSAGIVKGVLVGSTGVFKFSIKNGNDSVYCKVTFDGQTGMLLPTTSMATWQPGTSFAATFSGTIGGVAVSVYFKCNPDGSSPSATFTIPNHTISVNLYKETSTVLVKGYEGTYKVITIATNTEKYNGTFNFIQNNTVVSGTRSGTDGTGTFTGTVASGKLTIGTDVIDISETTVSGTILKTEGTEKIVVTGTRTL
jgi:hypothetical protein